MTGIEPATYGVTGRRANQLRYTLVAGVKLAFMECFVNRQMKNFFPGVFFLISTQGYT